MIELHQASHDARHRPRKWAGVLTAAFVALSVIVLPGGAAAQNPLVDPPPVSYSIDANGVDVRSGKFNYSSTDLTIGPTEPGGLQYARAYVGNGWRDNFTGTVFISGSQATVSVGGVSEAFTVSGSTFTPAIDRGSTLTFASGTYTYTTANGTRYTFSDSFQQPTGQPSADARLTNIASPSGDDLYLTYQGVHVRLTPSQPDLITFFRLQYVRSNRGYVMHFEYAIEDPIYQAELNEAYRITRVVAYNGAVDYCSYPFSNLSVPQRTCNFTQTWPSVNYTPTTRTDALSRETTFTFGADGITSIRSPGRTANDVTVTYSAGRVATIATSPGTQTYSYSTVGTTQTTTISGPGVGQTSVILTNTTSNRVTSVRDALNRTTSYSYDGTGRVTRVTSPEGQYADYTYGPRGNVVEVRRVAKLGSGLADVVTNASYPATCENFRTCNQPLTTTDARGGVTDYAYDPNHGGITSIARPAPAAGAARPTTLFTYVATTATWRNGNGTPQTLAPVQRVATVAICATNVSCQGSASESVTAITYGASNGANNALPITVQRRAGDDSVSSTESTAYNGMGDAESIDGPLAGSADIVRYRYDGLRRLIGEVGPDPDGAGALKHRAARVTYHANGGVSSTEVGTVNSQSDADWNAFAVLRHQSTTFDAQNARVLRQDSFIGGVAQSVTQYSYDSIGRLDCIAMRTNPSMFASLPSSACTAGIAGAYGPDRIRQNVYDVANQLTQVTSALGTPEARTEITAYTQNGLADWVEDGNGNRSDYQYDGFDRLDRLYFPQTAIGAHAANTSDYEQYAYDAASNLVQIRRRNGELIDYGYDLLNRRTSIDAPGASSDATFVFDNLGQMLSASDAGLSYAFGHDALGRSTSQTGPMGTVSYLYDAGSRRARMTWPDGFYVTYDYNVTGDLIAIRENGAASGIGVLATYAYDSLGRRNSITRGNGTATTFTFAAGSRDWSFAHDLLSEHDLSVSITMNPLGQMVGRTPDNAAYSETPPASGTTMYVRNGLNQATAVGAVNLAYSDGRGNLTSDGVKTYGYDVFNRLTSVNGTTFATFSPLGDLYQTNNAGVTTRFLYDGADIIGEYDDSGVLLRRFVHGPGVDEPLVWYEGASAADRRWLFADERGSIIAIANASGQATAINTYDPFGVPSTSNEGRFQYTGQAWLAEAGLYHYKARAYHPGLGRFLQTDPIGFAGGDLNLYAYVGNDPLNLTDPTGLTFECPPNGDDCITVTGTPPGCNAACQYFLIWGPHPISNWFPISPGNAPDFVRGDPFGDHPAQMIEIQDAGSQCSSSMATGAVAGAATGAIAGAAYCSWTGPGAAVCAGGGAIIGGMAAGGVVGTAAGVSACSTTATHGNSLKSPKPTWVYEIRHNRTNAVLKYGITSLSNPLARYPGWVYGIGNAHMVPLQQFPDRASARAEEQRLCQAYLYQNLSLPPWSLTC